MNKEYISLDGKVIVKDEKGARKLLEYYDNLDEVLVQENLIETINDTISYLEKEIEDYKKYNKDHYIPILLPLGALMTTIGPPAMNYCLGNTDVYVSSIDTIFGTMNEAVFYGLMYSALLLPIVSLIEYDIYSNHKKSLKKEKGINSQLEFLKKIIISEKEKLVKLKKEKTTDKENKEFRIVEVDDIEKLKLLKSWLKLVYDLGYNSKKYYKYYLQGKLDDKLGKYYTDAGIKVAKEYLEEKGPTLVKLRKQK